ncbi:SUMF1/EgtB/PvdO family nonheme iron enzyme [Thalassospira sp. TSL5-1]|uniref:formylglycine-generating enzyme family protein n=1 Tax=Thalassospira sp. TSL5-1 TaxID=1544451 RepID=UPI0009391669|nr:SUMF1/EgtB/PvdO family nonheme iron enzyme [Thalassospira sp. TSL5-1]OKH86743.1 nitrate reductase [Thalassospira sp. TSL5-1]
MMIAACQTGYRTKTFVIAGLLAASLWGLGACNKPHADFAYIPELAEHAITLPDGHQIYVQKFEVTIAQWNACHNDGACTEELRPPAGHDAARTPATGLNFSDVSQYLAWINHKSRHSFRLPTSQEWTFMAKPVLPEKADPIFTDPDLRWASAYLTKGLAPRALKDQGAFSTSPEGIADLDGSVWEWTGDCYAGSGVSSNPEKCPAYYVGGEHIAVIPFLVRDPARGGCAVGTPPAHLGFRLVTDEKPA